jgi:hypothetical protein
MHASLYYEYGMMLCINNNYQVQIPNTNTQVKVKVEELLLPSLLQEEKEIADS